MTTCAVHPDRDAINACVICGTMLCKECLYYIDSEPHCTACVSKREREYLAGREARKRRALLAGLIGAALSVGAVLGWQWGMFRTHFGLGMLTPFVMFCVVMALAMTMVRVAGHRSRLLCGIGVVLALGIMLGGERIVYDYALFQAAQQGLSAEKLLRFKEQNTFLNHLGRMGPFDYAFILLGVFFIWRRLWPARSDELAIVRPFEAE
jgi:hypothetical protein